MKRTNRYLIVLITVFLLAAALAIPAGAVRDPFRGSWEATDIDGSYMRLTVGGGPGGTYRTSYYDFGATVCGLGPGGPGDFLYAASARGTLSGAGSSISGDLPVYCQTSPPSYLFDATFTFTYDASRDILIDWLGVEWQRR